MFLASKFTSGAWLLLLIIPTLILMFARVQTYYRDVGRQLGLGHLPPKPDHPTSAPADGPLVVVPVVDVNLLTHLALQTALRLGGHVVPVAVDLDPDATERLRNRWKQWDPGVELRVLPSPHRLLVAPIVGFVHTHSNGRQVTVLLAGVEPRHRRQEILHNQRGLILAAALRARTDAVVATVPFRLTN